MGTGIEWTDETWNPTTGCDQVSPGCDRCYAMGMAKRLKGMGSPAYQLDGDPRTSGPGFAAHEWPAALGRPLRWRDPRMIFVNSMSDLFHDAVSDDYIAEVFAVMAVTPRHTYQVLTKRHGRMRSLLSSDGFRPAVAAHAGRKMENGDAWHDSVLFGRWPLPNVWGGVSAEDDKWAGIRIPALIDTPLAVRFLSLEPLLGPIDLDPWLVEDIPLSEVPGSALNDGAYACSRFTRRLENIHWIIAGGESGPGARPMHPEWARGIRDQAAYAGVPFLFKQWGEWRPPLLEDGHLAGRRQYLTADGAVLWRVGKHAAGRVLDGVAHDGYPAAARETVPT